jgi:hypothetical protein
MIKVAISTKSKTIIGILLKEKNMIELKRESTEFLHSAEAIGFPSVGII